MKESKKRIVSAPIMFDFWDMENNQYHFNLVAKAIAYIQEHHQKQPKLEEVAQHVHLSKFHFQRLFKKWAGISPKEFLQYLTVEKAKHALKKGQSTLSAAHSVGLSGNGRLHDLFVKIAACTPGEFRKRGKGIQIQWSKMDTPFGKAFIAETTKGICKLAFVDQTATTFLTELQDEFPQADLKEELGPNGKLVKMYFENWKIPNQTIGLDLKGTPFQIQVWEALLNIPPAQLLSYQDIANLIDRPKAVRAVGTAIGKNPIAYFIPCHRVIRNNGASGAYRWKAERKVAINAYEQVYFG